MLVDGKNFYPRMLEDIAAATSSIHVNQFGFRPGAIGETFAAALLAKAGEGVHVRLVVDRQGSDPERSSRQFDRLVAGRIQVLVVRARSCAPSMARWANTVRRGGTSRSSGTSTIARWWWSTAPWAGRGRGVEDHFNEVSSTTCFCGSPGRSSPAAGRLCRDLRMARRNRRPEARRALPRLWGFDGRLSPRRIPVGREERAELFRVDGSA